MFNSKWVKTAACAFVVLWLSITFNLISKSCTTSMNKECIEGQPHAGTKNVKGINDASPAYSTTTSSSLYLPVASWNIWFGSPHQSKRMDAIASLLMDTRFTYTGRPVLIGLQEVTNELSPYLYPKLRAEGYEIIEQDLSVSRYGCAVAVRTGESSFINASDSVAQVLSSGFVPYSTTFMGRGFVWVHARVTQPSSTSGKKEVLFTTTHLESPLSDSYNGVQERVSQLLEIRQFCEEFSQRQPSVAMAFVTGDLNWDDERYYNTNNDATEKQGPPLDQPLLSLMGTKWTDAWALDEDDARNDNMITYDEVENPMLQGNQKSRLDRILMFGMNNYSILHKQLIGKNPIPGIKWRMKLQDGTQDVDVLPSDHYGLVVNVKV